MKTHYSKSKKRKFKVCVSNSATEKMQPMKRMKSVEIKTLSVMVYVLQGKSGLRWLIHFYFCGFQDAFQNSFSCKLLSSLVFIESLLCAGEYCWVLRLWQGTRRSLSQDACCFSLPHWALHTERTVEFKEREGLFGLEGLLHIPASSCEPGDLGAVRVSKPS